MGKTWGRFFCLKNLQTEEPSPCLTHVFEEPSPCLPLDITLDNYKTKTADAVIKHTFAVKEQEVSQW